MHSVHALRGTRERRLLTQTHSKVLGTWSCDNASPGRHRVHEQDGGVAKVHGHQLWVSGPRSTQHKEKKMDSRRRSRKKERCSCRSTLWFRTARLHAKGDRQGTWTFSVHRATNAICDSTLFWIGDLVRHPTMAWGRWPVRSDMKAWMHNSGNDTFWIVGIWISWGMGDHDSRSLTRFFFILRFILCWHMKMQLHAQTNYPKDLAVSGYIWCLSTTFCRLVCDGTGLRVTGRARTAGKMPRIALFIAMGRSCRLDSLFFFFLKQSITAVQTEPCWLSLRLN